MACVGDRTRKRDNEVKVCEHTNKHNNVHKEMTVFLQIFFFKTTRWQSAIFFKNEAPKLLVSRIVLCIIFLLLIKNATVEGNKSSRKGCFFAAEQFTEC